MLFNWFAQRRRRKLLQESWPTPWLEALQQNVVLYQRLDASQQQTVRNIARILIAEKFWEGCAGFVVTDEVKVIIASQAAIMLLGLDHDYFDRVPTILVYPSAFHTAKPDDSTDTGFAMDKAAEGQAVYRGPVILAWDEVLHDSQRPDDGENVVIHEFAHQLDFLDNSVDGIPPLANMELRSQWKEIMNRAMEQHRHLVESQRPLFFAPAAAESVTEFFAYASEAYYCRPRLLAMLHPEVYRLLKEYYQVEITAE